MKALKIFMIVSMIMLVYVAFAGNDGDSKSNVNYNSTTTITGKVLDKVTGEALTGVKVEIEGTTISTYTDFEGNFNIQGIKPGTYNISTSLISYKEITENVNLNTIANEMSISLESLN